MAELEGKESLPGCPRCSSITLFSQKPVQLRLVLGLWEDHLPYEEAHCLWWAAGIEPACQETLEMKFQSLGQEYLLEESKATHPNILARKIPWTEKPSGLQSTGSHSQTQLKRHSTAKMFLVGTGVLQTKLVEVMEFQLSYFKS
ncbi:unnamed protein product [Rangifer tarandus platyrhynchus]|uniref:Uncharacterized protein n=1 Tax=Rangifer tarandus platyrhynchus TaxID=3082113 RepID=A0ABN8XW53_RANTA|nr:unnamed protein product [Rangifer tarandus platyrhynchus]